MDEEAQPFQRFTIVWDDFGFGPFPAMACLWLKNGTRTSYLAFWLSEALSDVKRFGMREDQIKLVYSWTVFTAWSIGIAPPVMEY